VATRRPPGSKAAAASARAPLAPDARTPSCAPNRIRQKEIQAPRGALGAPRAHETLSKSVNAEIPQRCLPVTTALHQIRKAHDPGDRGQFLRYVAEPTVKRRSDGNVRPPNNSVSTMPRPQRTAGALPKRAIVVAGKGSDTPDTSLDNSVFWRVVLACWGSDVIRSIEAARVYRGAWSIGGMATRGARAAATDACDRLPQ
jgi:hypothetical protein